MVAVVVGIPVLRLNHYRVLYIPDLPKSRESVLEAPSGLMTQSTALHIAAKREGRKEKRLFSATTNKRDRAIFLTSYR